MRIKTKTKLIKEKTCLIRDMNINKSYQDFQKL